MVCGWFLSVIEKVFLFKKTTYSINITASGVHGGLVVSAVTSKQEGSWFVRSG